MDPVERLRATYEFKPVDHLVRREFGIWQRTLDRWKAEGMDPDADPAALFGWDERAESWAWGLLGWCEPQFVPPMEEKLLESRGDYDIVRDICGRTVRFFKGERQGFMPTYLKHAVADDRDWHETIEPLLQPDTPERLVEIDRRAGRLEEAAKKGKFLFLPSIGGYMYLRSLIGPAEVCYMFVDNPGLIHKMMRNWLELADAVSARLQQHVELDAFAIAEDICYNHGLLISPPMVWEFILPYYAELLGKMRSRQARRLFFFVDTDGNVSEAIDLYREVGMDVMSPFEIAAGNDVLQIAEEYPDLVMLGGIDKRVLAAGKQAIDDYLEQLIPPMVRRGGYIPTCDHDVPDNVSYENYLHYRRRIMELDH